MKDEESTVEISSNDLERFLAGLIKENGLNLFPYLEYLFEKLPNIDKTDEKQLSEFLPWSKS